MARFRINATWREAEVLVVLERTEPDVGILDFDTEVSRVEVGRMSITEPIAMTPRNVRRAALEQLALYLGMTDQDSYELQMWSDLTRDQLERLVAALAG